MKHLLALFIAAALLATSCNRQQTPTNADQATQAALQEWKNDHFGLFIHFGVYSHLGGIWNGEQIPFYGEQIMNHARIPIDQYEAVAHQFNPIDFNADSIVLLAKQAGMKYIVFTTKHHDGFCLFDTKTTNYDIVDFTPYGKDIVAQLADACHRHDIKLGFYYSLPDWHFAGGIPRLLPDSSTHCWEHVNQVYSPLEIITPELEEYIVAQVTELLSNYGPVAHLWFDMGLMQPEQSQRLRNLVKSLQPSCLINGRIMNSMGDYMTLPDNGDVASYGDIYWDNPASLYGTWGYKSWINRPPLDEQISRQLNRLCSTVRHGGVFLLNIGPDATGRVIDYEQQVLRGIGDFLSAHPDTLNRLAQMPADEPQVIVSQNSDITLTPSNGLYHAALDRTGYMSVEPHSYLSWEVEAPKEAEYDIFVIYNPEHNDAIYRLDCGTQQVKATLPGVDRMIQTAYMGKVKLTLGRNHIVFDKNSRTAPLEPLGLDLQRIILRPSSK